MLRSIRGIIKLEISGYAYEKMLNDMSANSIPCFNIKVRNECLYLEIYKKYFSRVDDICQKYNLGLNILSRKGIVFRILRYKKRYGIVAGILLFIVVSFLLSNTVLKIDINGNDNIPDEKIIEFLNKNNVDYWSFIPGIDMENMGRRMYIEFDDISWATVRNSGGILIVDIREGTDKPDMVPLNQKCNVISDKDAQIIKIKVYSGTPLVKEGDGIAKGNIIISGIVTDKFGKSEAVRADGKIIARYTEEVCFYQPLEYTALNQSDKTEHKSLCLWGKRLFEKNDISSENIFRKETSISNFNFLNIKLPIGIANDTYYIYKYEKKTETPLSAEEKCMDKIKNYEKIFYSDKVILNKEIVKQNDSKGIKIKVIYTIDSEIGVKQNIIV